MPPVNEADSLALVSNVQSPKGGDHYHSISGEPVLLLTPACFPLLLSTPLQALSISPLAYYSFSMPPCHLSKFHIYVLVYCIGVFLSGLLHSV